MVGVIKLPNTEHRNRPFRSSGDSSPWVSQSWSGASYWITSKPYPVPSFATKKTPGTSMSTPLEEAPTPIFLRSHHVFLRVESFQDLFSGRALEILQALTETRLARKTNCPTLRLPAKHGWKIPPLSSMIIPAINLHLQGISPFSIAMFGSWRVSAGGLGAFPKNLRDGSSMLVGELASTFSSKACWWNLSSWLNHLKFLKQITGEIPQPQPPIPFGNCA